MTNKLKLQSTKGLLFLKEEEILYFQSAENYTELYTNTGTKHLLQASLTTLEDLSSLFFRCHRSYLVNLHKLYAYHDKEKEIALEEIVTGLSVSGFKHSSRPSKCNYNPYTGLWQGEPAYINIETYLEKENETI